MCEHDWEVIDNVDCEDGSTETFYICLICGAETSEKSY